MSTRLIIDGNAVYEIDEDCLEYQKKKPKCRDGKNAGNPRLVNQIAEEDTRDGK